jgi:hypothetical protein
LPDDLFNLLRKVFDSASKSMSAKDGQLEDEVAREPSIFLDVDDFLYLRTCSFGGVEASFATESRSVSSDIF